MEVVRHGQWPRRLLVRPVGIIPRDARKHGAYAGAGRLAYNRVVGQRLFRLRGVRKAFYQILVRGALCPLSLSLAHSLHLSFTPLTTRACLCVLAARRTPTPIKWEWAARSALSSGYGARTTL